MIRLPVAGALGPRPTILCLGAHADDIEIGCGGTILRLLAEIPDVRVTWVVLTSTPERSREAQTAAALFLADAAAHEVIVHPFRDGYLPYEGAAVKDAFEALKTKVDPSLVFTHHRSDRHQDHRLIGELTWNTFRNHLILEYEVPKYDGDLGAPNVFVPLEEAVCRRKIDLLDRAFGLQRSKSWFRSDTFWSLLRLRGIEARAPSGFAEAFHGHKVLL